jgi:hypothetical protein
MANKTLNKKNCLKWLMNKYKGRTYKNENKDAEYKEYESLCATRENIANIENLHLYFNDNNLLRSIYKQMAIDYNLCFLKDIIIVENIQDGIPEIQLKVNKNNNLVPFDDKIYMTEIDICKDNMFVIPIKADDHANLLIINKEKKEIELFEPHGKIEDLYKYNNRPHFYKLLISGSQIICDTLFSDYKFIKSPFGCKPIIGFQALLNKLFKTSKFSGTCTIWSMWYAYIRLSNQNLNCDEAYDYAIKFLEDETNLENFIIYLINAFQNHVNILRNSNGRPYKIEGYNKLIRQIIGDKIIYPSGNIYIGEQTDNKNAYGKGKMFYKRVNLEYEGYFIKNNLDETKEFIITFLDPSSGIKFYKGFIKDAKPNGKGIMVFIDDKIKEGIWKNGNLIDGQIKHKDDKIEIIKNGNVFENKSSESITNKANKGGNYKKYISKKKYSNKNKSKKKLNLK